MCCYDVKSGIRHKETKHVKRKRTEVERQIGERLGSDLSTARIGCVQDRLATRQRVCSLWPNIQRAHKEASLCLETVTVTGSCTEQRILLRHRGTSFVGLFHNRHCTNCKMDVDVLMNYLETDCPTGCVFVDLLELCVSDLIL